MTATPTLKMWKTLGNILNLSIPPLPKNGGQKLTAIVTKKPVKFKKVKKWIKKYGGLILTAPIVTVIIILVRFAGLLEIAELKLRRVVYMEI